MATFLSVLSLVVTSAAPASASPPEPPCIPDPDGDGHPVFSGAMQIAHVVAPFGDDDNRAVTGAAIGDVDGDGRLDVVCVSFASFTPGQTKPGYLTVLRGRQGGLLALDDVEYETGPDGCDVQLADMDHDGDLDAVVANAHGEGPSTVAILRNDGDGTFAVPQFYSVGTQARSVALADVDGDGWTDVASLNCVSKDVSILINSGEWGGGGNAGLLPEVRIGGFLVTPRQDPGGLGIHQPATGPRLRAGDVDGDGDLDLVIPSKFEARFLINDGSGVFALADTRVPGVASSYTRDVRIVDLNGDAWPDLAMVAPLGVALGTGPLQFAPPVAVPTADGFSWTIDAADMDGNATIDLIVGRTSDGDGLFSPRGSSWLAGKGNGTFEPFRLLANRGNAWVALARDVDGDGLGDAVLASFNEVVVHPGRASTGPYGQDDFELPPAAPKFFAQWQLQRADDFDRDGDMDLIAAGSNSATPPYLHLAVVKNTDGEGTLNDQALYAINPAVKHTVVGLGTGDLTGDGWPDALLVSHVNLASTVHWTVMAGGPGGVLTVHHAGVIEGVIPLLYDGLGVADFDGDGDLDAAVMAAEWTAGQTTPVMFRVEVLANAGDGQLMHARSFDLRTLGQLVLPGALAIGDYDGDGHPDLAAVVANQTVNPKQPPQSTVHVLRNLHDGMLGFQPATVWETGDRVVSLATIRLDGRTDERLAALVGLPLPPASVPVYTFPKMRSAVVTLKLEGMELVTTATREERGDMVGEPLNHISKIVPADMNGDGQADLLTIGAYQTGVMIGDGAGGFSPVVLTASSGSSPAVAAFDSRPRLDVASYYDLRKTLLARNASCGKPGCHADCDVSNTLDIDDFICFQTFFALGDPKADCNADGTLAIDDFICFQTAFVLGC